ncbi:DUF2628 domain-containing protein [Mesorhizobium sp. KR2-14]|uniref:DUF2628 domain-containing protein n=1 Tax=Mesorhizobium sp. KR2-14 TaxID=3156610 RepID=UPI0032B57CDA
MAAFVVLEPPTRSASAASERAVLVRDGFSLLAFLVAPLWLLWHRLWVETLLYFAVALALAALGKFTGHEVAGSLLSLLVSIYFGLEGAALRIAALRRRGWREWGVVEANSAQDAEMRYLGEVGNGNGEAAAPLADTPPRAPARPGPTGPALGLLNYPGRA